tara:strand:+ start:337 stop:471 length:135 start_codon:yes stop_codon:yes gene_type:complete
LEGEKAETPKGGSKKENRRRKIENSNVVRNKRSKSKLLKKGKNI